MSLNKLCVYMGIALLSLMVPTGYAAADFVFDLNTGSPQSPPFFPDFAKVDVHLQDSTNATITFTSLKNDLNNMTYLLGSGSQGPAAVAVNVNAKLWTVSSITGSNSGLAFSPGQFTKGGSGTMGVFGTFNQTINDQLGFIHAATSLSFTLTNLSGTWTDASNVLAQNERGGFAAGQIFVSSIPADYTSSLAGDGFASNLRINVPVPEPATLLLFGSGLLVLACLRRRFNKN